MSKDRTAALLRVLLLLISLGAGSQALAQVVLYEHDNFQGRTYGVSRQAPNLAHVGFNDIASSVVIRSGGWQLCSDAGYQGQCVTLGPGRYASLRSMGLNDRLSSVRAAASTGGGHPQTDVTLYEHDGFAGRSFPVAREVSNLATVGFNDVASSVVIRSGRWQLCSDAGYRGQCVTLATGRYPSLGAMGLNDRLSSVRRVR